MNLMAKPYKTPTPKPKTGKNRGPGIMPVKPRKGR